MTEPTFAASHYNGTGPENYERYFVPAIGGPLALDLMSAAAIQDGERVLDVACGTGVVARLAAERVGRGAVAGVDVNPGMLAVARASSGSGSSIDWYETSAEAMPLPTRGFDVVLCQLGLQFVDNKPQALSEMQRVLSEGGRLVTTVAGPRPELFGHLAAALATHIDPGCARFINVVFSLSDSTTLRELLEGAGFKDVEVTTARRTLGLPADFLWQYIHSTPLAGRIAQATDAQRAALEADVHRRWEPFTRTDGLLSLDLEMITASGVATGAGETR